MRRSDESRPRTPPTSLSETAALQRKVSVLEQNLVSLNLLCLRLYRRVEHVEAMLAETADA